MTDADTTTPGVPPSELYDLSGRVALVTGASRGIGAAIARALDRAGARVVLTARDVDRLDASAAELRHDPVTIVADLADPDAPASVARQALEACGQLDVLVNNAATAARMDTADTDAAVIDLQLAVNVRAPILLVGSLVDALAASGRGSVVNLSSVSGLVGTPRRAAYAASKGAIDAMTRSLAMELGPRGIRVNAVAPGVVDTDLWARNRAVPGVIEQIEAQTPMRRWGRAEDIADAVVFLTSDAARFVTAQTLSVDGGMAHTLDLYGGAV